MDRVRAVIVGAEATPYHDGLFFFDVCFPSGYPNVPPVCDNFELLELICICLHLWPNRELCYAECLLPLWWPLI